MPILHINVAKKIATYNQRDGIIVCGNSDYQIKFAFDSEWDAHEKKTARFIWRGQYQDVDFTGDTCAVPIITGAFLLEVGVYAGELSTTTSASIGCQKSILCQSGTPSTENDRHYANEAKEAAERAEASAAEATAAAETAMELVGDTETNSKRIDALEEHLNVFNSFKTAHNASGTGYGTTSVTVPSGARNVAKIYQLKGDTATWYYGNQVKKRYAFPDYPKYINVNSGRIFTFPAHCYIDTANYAEFRPNIEMVSNLADSFGFHPGNTIYTESNRWYYEQRYRFHLTESKVAAPSLLDDEQEVLKSYIYENGYLVKLKKAITTEITSKINQSPYITLNGATNVGIWPNASKANNIVINTAEGEEIHINGGNYFAHIAFEV